MLIPIDKIVRDACRHMGDTDYKYYSTMLQFVHDCLRDLYLYVIPDVNRMTYKTIVKDCTGNKTIDLPFDYVYYTKIGLKYRGKIFLLTRRDDFVDVECEEPININECDRRVKFYNYFNNGQFGELYGLTGGRNALGYYTEDRPNNRILFRSIPDDAQVVLEYKSNGVGDGAELIPTECENAIRYYALMHRYHSLNAGMANNFERLYKVEYRKLKKLYQSMTQKEWEDILYSTQSLAR